MARQDVGIYAIRLRELARRFEHDQLRLHRTQLLD